MAAPLNATCKHCGQPITGHTNPRTALFFWAHASSGSRGCDPDTMDTAEPVESILREYNPDVPGMIDPKTAKKGGAT
jgi:hypothetical protein